MKISGVDVGLSLAEFILLDSETASEAHKRIRQAMGKKYHIVDANEMISIPRSLAKGMLKSFESKKGRFGNVYADCLRDAIEGGK